VKETETHDKGTLYMRAQFTLAIIAGALLSGAFAAAANFLSGAQLIGISTVSGIIIGAIFGVVGAFCVTLASILSKKDGKLFFFLGGALFGAIMYVANVVLGYNAGFSLFGLGLISCFGLMSGIGSWFSSDVFKGLSRLQHLS